MSPRAGQIGRRVREFRKGAKLNQTQLGALVGLKADVISSIELGHKHVELETMEKIARVLCKSIAWFYVDDPETTAV